MLYVVYHRSYPLLYFDIFITRKHKMSLKKMNFQKGDPLVSLDFFENPMAHPRMKVQVLGSLKLPLAKKNFGEKSVGKHDF